MKRGQAGIHEHTQTHTHDHIFYLQIFGKKKITMIKQREQKKN